MHRYAYDWFASLVFAVPLGGGEPGVFESKREKDTAAELPHFSEEFSHAISMGDWEPPSFRPYAVPFSGGISDLLPGDITPGGRPHEPSCPPSPASMKGRAAGAVTFDAKF